MTGKVRILNQGKRTIHIGPQQALKPTSIALVTEDTAKKLLRLYPKELVDLDNMSAGIDTGGIKDFTQPAEEAAPTISKPAAALKKGKKGAKVADDDEALAGALQEDE